MGSRTVARVIAELDARSRQRALTNGETIQLQKMIAMERRYAAMRQANEMAGPAARDQVQADG